MTHPRIKFGFYTSITRKNAWPIVYKVFDKRNSSKLAHLFKNDRIMFFDQTHCGVMIEDKVYKKLAENDWDFYKDLRRVFDSDFNKDEETDEQLNSFANTLLVESDSAKV
jgi:hypothetical protein